MERIHDILYTGTKLAMMLRFKPEKKEYFIEKIISHCKPHRIFRPTAKFSQPAVFVPVGLVYSPAFDSFFALERILRMSCCINYCNTLSETEFEVYGFKCVAKSEYVYEIKEISYKIVICNVPDPAEILADYLQTPLEKGEKFLFLHSIFPPFPDKNLPEPIRREVEKYQNGEKMDWERLLEFAKTYLKVSKGGEK